MKITSKTALAACMLLAISCSKESLRNPQPANTQTQDNSIDQATSHHYIGERFGGGIIFYLNDSIGKHGLIADTVDLPNAPWYNGSYVSIFSSSSLGAGKENTLKILKSQGQPISEAYNYAAWECHKSIRSGYKDWFLPSVTELDELYKQKDVVGGFANNIYWSSTEYNLHYACCHDFEAGYNYRLYRYSIFYVRAIRAF